MVGLARKQEKPMATQQSDEVARTPIVAKQWKDERARTADDRDTTGRRA